MDILALLTLDGTLMVNRTTSWQCLLAPTDAVAAGAISALCWSPDGRQLALGHRRGGLSILDVEAGALVSRTCYSDHMVHNSCISLMFWARQVTAKGTGVPAGYRGRVEQHLTAARHPYFSARDCESDGPIPLTLLVTGDDAGAIILSINGLFPIVRMQLSGPAAVAVTCCTSGDLRTLYMWVQTVDGPKLESYELGFLATDQTEVLPLIETYLKACVLLQTAEKARETASKAWDDALLPLDRKLALYTSDLRQWSAGKTGPCPSARAEFLALVRRGVAGSATAHFLEDILVEPSLSRMHNAVETAANSVESILSNRLLASSRLLCHYAGELVASCRLGYAGFEPNQVGLNLGLCRKLLSTAEGLVLATQDVVSSIRRAHLALSGLFRWFKIIHTMGTTMKKTFHANERADIVKLQLKFQDQQDMATLLETRPVDDLGILSKTEELLGCSLKDSLNNSVTKQVGESGDTICRSPDYSDPKDVATAIRAVLETERLEEANLSGVDSPPSGTLPLHSTSSHAVDVSDDDSSVVIHKWLGAVGVAMDKVFEETRSRLATTVRAISSTEFPTEVLNDGRHQRRCSFTAHIPDICDKSMATAADHDSLEGVSALIQANSRTLWLLKSKHHDSIRFWLGLRTSNDTSIVQAQFYASEQGNFSKNAHRIAVLARRREHVDEIWLIDGNSMLDQYGAQQSSFQSKALCMVKNVANWSYALHHSAPIRCLQSNDIRKFSLFRPRSCHFCVSGCRGVACVLADPSFLTLYDLEDQQSDSAEN